MSSFYYPIDEIEGGTLKGEYAPKLFLSPMRLAFNKRFREEEAIPPSSPSLSEPKEPNVSPYYEFRNPYDEPSEPPKYLPKHIYDATIKEIDAKYRIEHHEIFNEGKVITDELWAKAAEALDENERILKTELQSVREAYPDDIHDKEENETKKVKKENCYRIAGESWAWHEWGERQQVGRKLESKAYEVEKRYDSAMFEAYLRMRKELDEIAPIIDNV